MSQRRLVLVGNGGPALERVEHAVVADPPLARVERQPEVDVRAPGPAPELALVDTCGLEPQHAVACVAKAVLAWPATAVLTLTGSTEPSLVRAVLDAGAVSVVRHETCPADTRAAVAAAFEGRGLIDVGIVRPTIDLYASLLAESRRRDRAVIESLAAAVEAKDSVTSRHLRRVSRLATQLAELVDPELARCEDFLFGCLLHDVGKIGVPEEILGKPGPLTDDEWIVMRRHPQTGARVIRPLGLSDLAHDVVRSHHERWDGGGYPDGLSGADIPLASRIFSVCDALEAMTAARPYRGPLPAEVAFERVRIEAGAQFDPRVVEALEEGVSSGTINLEDPTGVEPDPTPVRRFAREGLVGFRG